MKQRVLSLSMFRKMLGALAASRWHFLLGLFLWGLTVHTPVWAKDASPQQREQARGLLDRGDELMAVENFRGALEAYQGAHELMGVPTTGIEVGRAQRRLGLLVEARDTWIQVTRLPVAPDEPAPFVQAREEAAQLALEIGQLIPTISVRVEGAAASDTSIYLDDTLLSRAAAGLPLRVNPGAHRLRAEADGCAPTSSELTLSEGESRSVTLKVVKCAAPAGADKGAGGSDEPKGDENEGISLKRGLGFGALGVGAVGVSLGSVFGILSLGHASRAKENCDGNACTQAADSDIDAAKSTGTVSTVGFIVGAVGVSAGLYLLLSPENVATQARVRRHAIAFESWQIKPRLGGAQVCVEGAFF